MKNWRKLKSQLLNKQRYYLTGSDRQLFVEGYEARPPALLRRLPAATPLTCGIQSPDDAGVSSNPNGNSGSRT
jgi:hypothetical protein